MARLVRVFTCGTGYKQTTLFLVLQCSLFITEIGIVCLYLAPPSLTAPFKSGSIVSQSAVSEKITKGCYYILALVDSPPHNSYPAPGSSKPDGPLLRSWPNVANESRVLQLGPNVGSIIRHDHVCLDESPSGVLLPKSSTETSESGALAIICEHIRSLFGVRLHRPC